MKFRTLKFRLNFWYTVVFLVAFLIAGMGIYFYLDISLHKELDRFLEREASEIAEKILTSGFAISFSDSSEFYEPEHCINTESAVYFRVFDRYGRVVASSKNFNMEITSPKMVSVAGTNEIEVGGKRLRIFYLPIYSGKENLGWIEVSKFEGAVQSAMMFLKASLIFALFFAVMIASYGGGVIVAKLISPLEQIIDTANKMNAENLTQQIKIDEKNSSEEIVKLVQTLNSLFKRLDISFKRISQFTSDVAHELLTPLTVIKDEIEITLSKRRRANEYIQTLKVLQKQTDRSISIIKSMLYLAKADAGMIKANFQEVEIGEMLREIISLFNSKARRKNIKLRLICPPEICAKTDANLLFDALKNIVDNAVEYTEKGGEVTVGCERKDDEVLIFVNDSGIGIPEDELPYIFDRFYRGGKALEINSSGTGLGLALTKAMLDIISAKVEVESRVGEGTKFRILIPLA